MNARMIHRYILCFLAIVFLFGYTSPAATTSNSTGPITSGSISEVISRYRQQISQSMQQDNIPGLAIAIVDDKNVLWMEGFGYTDWDSRTPITPDTLFSIQSMSKSFTATAAMFAAQDGLVDLDAPITDYLPDFHVNSIFEDQPEQKMTLRILLSHTAGFTHEAPYGGNYDLPAYSFEKHIASISDTWLRFPVGLYYGYSNLGIDLAGYILQVRSGMPFIQYVQEKVLQPLGMLNSTLDVQQVRANRLRAIGHTGAPFPPPVDYLIIPSGGVWTTTSDMAGYLQFQINEGAINGHRLLDADLAETMYTPPNIPAQLVGSGLGIDLNTRNGARHFQHGGGGFGFNSSMVWYPDLKLGSVVLTNAVPNVSLAYNLSEEVLDSIIASSPGVYSQRAETTTPIKPAYPQTIEVKPLTNIELSNLIASKALPADDTTINRWQRYTGKYIVQTSGIPGDEVQVSFTGGTLSVDYLGEDAAMTETAPGLFFSPTGIVLDLRSADLMFNNMHIFKADAQAHRIRVAVYAISGLLFLSALLFWPVRSLFRRIRRQKTTPLPDILSTGKSWLVYAGLGIGIASIISLVCLVIIVLIPNLIYLHWPRPYTELTFWQHLLFYLPYISLVLAVTAAVFAGLAYKIHSLERLMQIYFLVAVVDLLVFNIVILV